MAQQFLFHLGLLSTIVFNILQVEGREREREKVNKRKQIQGQKKESELATVLQYTFIFQPVTS